MNGTFPDGFPKDPYQAVEFSYFLSEQEKQEWWEWIPNANQASQQELVETLHEIWKEHQKNAVPGGFADSFGDDQLLSEALAAGAIPPVFPNNQVPAAAPAYFPATPAGNPSAPQNPVYQNPPNPIGSAFVNSGDSPANAPANAPVPPPSARPAMSAPQGFSASAPAAAVPSSQTSPSATPPDPFGFPGFTSAAPSVKNTSNNGSNNGSKPTAGPAAPTMINVPPFVPPPEPEDKQTSNHVNEFYFSSQNGSDGRTTITPPKTQTTTNTSTVTEPPRSTTANATSSTAQATTDNRLSQNKGTATANNADAKPTKDTSTTENYNNNNTKAGQNTNTDASKNSKSGNGNGSRERDNSINTQILRDQLNLLKKMAISLLNVEKSVEEIRINQAKLAEAKSAPVLDEVAQKIQRDTGNLSSMVNTLYDEIAVLRTTVENQQLQLRTLGAHVRNFYTQPQDELPAAVSQPVSQMPTVKPDQVPVAAQSADYANTQVSPAMAGNQNPSNPVSPAANASNNFAPNSPAGTSVAGG